MRVSARPPARRRTVIESLGVYLPEARVSTAEVVAGCARPLRMPLERFTGIQGRRVAAPGEYSIDLARAAAADCLSRSRYRAEDVDLLISASISHFDGPGRHYTYEPAAALQIKAACGFENAIAFDISNGCAGLWTGVLFADALIRNQRIRCAMVVSGELISPLIDTAQQEIVDHLDPQVASLTVGDSGAALMLEAGDGAAGFEALDLFTLGEYSRYCMVRPSDRPHGGGVMVTDSVRLGAAAIEHVVPHLVETLEASQWSPRDLDLLVPHQTSEIGLRDGFKRINQQLAPRSIPPERYVINLAERANTATTTHLVALRDAIELGRLRSGDRTAFCISGSGLTVGTALYTFDDLPDRERAGAPDALRPEADEGPSRPRLEPPVAQIAAVGLLGGDEARELATEELCLGAARDCLERAGRSVADIGLMIHAGVYRTDFLAEPAIASLVCGALGAGALARTENGAVPTTRPFAFDVLAGHLGALKACWLADCALRAGVHESALVLASDIAQESLGESLGVEPCGSALWIAGSQRGAGFELFHFRDFTEHLHELDTWLGNPDGHPRLMVSRCAGWPARAAHCLAKTVHDLLADLDLGLGDFGAVLAPGGSPELRVVLAGALGVAASDLVSAPATGDLMGSSLAASLRHLAGTGRAGPGDRILVLAVGGGIQTGCAVLRMGDP